MKYSSESFSDLGKKIRALRIELGLTQKELSEGIVTRNMLSRIENGEALPSLSTLSEIADRLNVKIGYLVDDHDDGSKLKNERLLSMIKKEFSEGNYALCLQYLNNLDYYPEEKERLTACSLFLLGVKKSYDSSPVKDAQKLISDSLKMEKLLTHKMINEGKVFRALLDGFSFSPESGTEESYILRLSSFASFCDLSLFSSVLNVLRSNGSECASNMLSFVSFENQAYSSLLLAIIALDEKKHNAAMSRLIEASGGELPSPIRCYCLTLLEKCSAMRKEFEKAYSYMTMRKELVNNLLKKVENSEIYY